MKVNLGRTNNDVSSTFVYVLTGYKTNENGETIGCYMYTPKRGYNARGHAFIDVAERTSGEIFYGDAVSNIDRQLGLFIINFNSEVKTMFPPQVVQGFSPININENTATTEDVIKSFEELLTGKINELYAVNSVTYEKEGVQYSKANYTKSTVETNPEVAFVFTDNAEAYTTAQGIDGYTFVYKGTPTLNVSEGSNKSNQAVIRTDENGNVNENAFGVIVKKYQQDSRGKFVNNMTACFKDTDADFEMFKTLNTHMFERLANSSYNGKVFPEQIALGKAGLPLRFAQWLQAQLAERFGLNYTIKENQLKTYAGLYGLERSKNNDGFIKNNITEEKVDRTSRTYEQPTGKTGHQFTFEDGTVVDTDFELNEQQQNALKQLEMFYNSLEEGKTVFVLQGYAGTGKTSIMKIFDQYLLKHGVDALYAAPTHKANKVTAANNPGVNIKTVAALLSQKPLVTVDPLTLRLDEGKLFEIDNRIIIIDECSMINSTQYEKLMQSVKYYNNLNKPVQIIFMGDPAQLSPINEGSVSKTLTDDSENVTRTELTKVERTGDNAILREATNLRNGEELSYETSLNNNGQGVIFTDEDGAEVQEFLEDFASDIYEHDSNYIKCLCYRNNTVTSMNKRIREIRYGQAADTKPLLSGEILTSYRTITNDSNDSKETLINNSFDYKVISTNDELKPSEKSLFAPIYSKLMKLGIKMEIPNSSSVYTVKIVEADAIGADEKTLEILDPKDKKTIMFIQHVLDVTMSTINFKPSPEKVSIAREIRAYLNTLNTLETIEGSKQLVSNQLTKTFDYGYAMTIDKSQGSTYSKVFIIGADMELSKLINDKTNYKQHQYVALSRAKNKVLYLTTRNANKINITIGDKNGFESLSNFADRPFEHNDKKFPTVEHAYQYWKLSHASEKDTRFRGTTKEAFLKKFEIGTKLKASGAKANGNVFKLAKQIIDKIDIEKRDVMKTLIKESLEQNPEAKALLMSTGDKILTHNVGQNEDYWTKTFPEILMEIREDFKGGKG